MIRTVLKSLCWMVVYGCVATVIAQAVLLVFIAKSWQLDKDRMTRALAVAQGVDLSAPGEPSSPQRGDVSREHVAYEEVLDARAVKVRHLELREQALAEGLGQLDREQRKLTEEHETVARLKKAFDAQLLAIREQAVSEGIEDTRAKLMAIKPTQAKLLLDDLLERDEIQTVVTLIRGMPDTKSSKIITEFKSEEDLQRIGEILRLIIEGDAVADLAATAGRQLQNP